MAPRFDTWLWQQALGLLVLTCICLWTLIKTSKDQKFAPLIWAWAFMVVHSVMSDSLLCALQLLIFGILFARMGEAFTRRGLVLIIFIMAGDAVWLLMGNKFGVLDAHTFDTAIMALLLPVVFMIFKNKWVKFTLSFLFVTAILCSKSMSALVVLGVTHFFFALMVSRYWGTKSVVSLVPLGVLYFFKDKIFDWNGRLEMWKAYLDFFLSRPDKFWFGWGLGSFETLTLKIPVGGIFYRSAHNDFLQLLIETGVVGLTVYLSAIGWTLYKVRHNAIFFSWGMGYIALSLVYFPGHFFLSQMLVIFFIKRYAL